jgi:hypothetical protein
MGPFDQESNQASVLNAFLLLAVGMIVGRRSLVGAGGVFGRELQGRQSWGRKACGMRFADP